MPLVSITRLRLRSTRYVVPFLWYALRSRWQAQAASGNLGAVVRRARGAFWTLSVWQDQAAMRAFMLGGAHRSAMARLRPWCDEASLAHWQQQAATLPSWAEAEQRLARDGRISAVAHPSPAHAAGHTLGSDRG